jgi:ABC-2 type transport system ATP-binding protein
MRYSDTFQCEVHLVEHCNLNCKGCYHFSPLAKEEFLFLTEWEKDCKQLSTLFKDRIGHISLMGGEPLLHPDICEFMRITREISLKEIYG